MEQRLKCFPQLTLSEMSLRRTIVHLWNGSDILALIVDFRMRKGSIINWEIIEDKVKDKILKLGLPKLLTKQMIDVVRPIGLEIKRWKQFHEETFYFTCIEIYEHNSPKLYFTTAGTIDNRRTAEELAKCVRLDIMQRYQIACSYWLEDYIPFLWEELTEEDKEYFSKKNPTFQGLEFSWPHIFKGRESSLDSYLRNTDRYLTSFNQWAFEHSVKKGCKATAKYFFHKLTDEERDASLMRCARTAFLNKAYGLNERLYDVFCYLVSLMTPNQQMEIVKTCPLGVLSCFLDWPRRDLFLENASLIWPYIPPRVYGDLLLKVIAFYDKNYFPTFFPDFYKQSPLAFQDCFVHEEKGVCKFLSAFFNSDDSESIKVVFRNLDVADRVKLVFLRCNLLLFYTTMLKNKWPLVELCLQEAMLSGEDKKRLKETFISHLGAAFLPLNYRTLLASRNGILLPFDDKDPKLNSFYDFLDGNNAIADKEKNGQEDELEKLLS